MAAFTTRLWLLNTVKFGVKESPLQTIDRFIEPDEIVIEIIGHAIEERLQPNLLRCIRITLLWFVVIREVGIRLVNEKPVESATLIWVVGSE